MADEMVRRRERVATAFAKRRKELGLTQQDVAQRADVVVKSVFNVETHRRMPNASTRARLEEALEWPPGEIERIADGPQVNGDGSLLAAIDRLQDELNRLRAEYDRSQRKTNGHDGDGAHRAG